MRRFLYVLVALFFPAVFLSAADWAAFHGPDGNNKSPDTGLQKKWADGGPKLLWTADFIGFGYSGVAISGNKIYITGNVQREGKDLSMVFCLDKNGKLIWEKDNGPAHTKVHLYPGTRGTPAVDSNFVYDISATGEVTCYDTTKNGEKVWNRNLFREYNTPLPYWHLGNAVLIEGNYVIYPLGGHKHIAIALNKKTGETVWGAEPVADPAGAVAGYVTPYAFDFEGIRAVTVMSDSTVEGFEAKTGKKLFSIPFRNRLVTNCTMPIYHNGCLFLTTGYDFGAKMFTLTKNVDGTINAAEVWYEKRFDNHHGGVILVGDYVYGSTFNGLWRSINFMTGEIGYTSRSFGKGSIHYADGLFYCLSEDDKTVGLVQPAPTEFIELSHFELPNEAEGSSWAHPVVLDGRLYLRHAQYLYCYDVLAQNCEN